MAAILFVLVVLTGSSRAAGCTITWVGDVNGNWYGGTSGSDTNWDNNLFPTATDDVCINNTGAQPVTVDGNTVIKDYTIGAGASVVIPAQRTLRATANSTNSGTISLTDQNATLSTENADDTNTETLTNTSTGTISIPAGGLDGNRSIAGDVANQGTITVGNAGATFWQQAESRNPKLTNTGTLTVASGGLLTFYSSTLEQQTGGTVNGPGTTTFGGGAAKLRVAGGAIAASAELRVSGGTQLVFLGGTPTGTIHAYRSGSTFITGNVPAGITINVEGAQAFQSALIATASYTNAGTITLSGAATELRTEDGNALTTETLTNTGTISVPVVGPSNDGFRFIEGDVNNQGTGTITIADPETSFQQAAEDRNPKLTNTGTLTVAGTGLLRMLDSALELQNGGTINGPGPINLSGGAFGSAGRRLIVAGGTIAPGANLNLQYSGETLQFTGGSPTGRIHLDKPGNVTLLGNVPAGITIDAEALPFTNGANLISTTSYTNAGTINLIGPAELRTEDGNAATTETLTNTGTIAYKGVGGNPTISGDLVNQGTISVDHPGARFTSNAESRDPKLTNSASGTLSVSAGNTLTFYPGFTQPFANAGTVLVSGALSSSAGYTQSAGTTTLQTSTATISAPITLTGGTLGGVGTVTGNVTNGGLVSPGTASTPGTLSVNGTYTQQAGGVLSARVRSSANDRLSATGAATLDGTLAINSAGFDPPVGQAYTVLSGGTRTGQFSTITGASSGPYDVAYDATQVKLMATAKPPPGSTAGLTFSIDNPSVVNPGSGDAMLTFTVKLSAANPAGATVAYATANGTAQAPGDYASQSGTLTFGPSETEKAVSVTVHGVSTAGPDRVLFVNLTSPTNATIADGQGIGTILNDRVVVSSVSPSSGGTGGNATVTLRGEGFSGHPTFKLVRAGQPDILATNVTVTGGARTLTGTLGLQRAATGPYDVVVTLPEAGISRTVPGGFTVAPLRPPVVDVNLIGSDNALGDYPDSLLVVYCNRGNVDVTNLRIRVTGFKDGDVTVLGAKSYKVVADGSGFAVEMIIENIPAGSCGAAVVRFTPRGSAHSKYHLEVIVLPPPVPPPPVPPPPDGGAAGVAGGLTIDVRRSGDPNLKSGPPGYGRKRYISSASRLPYLVQFENKPSATAPAHEVRITDQLDPSKVDLSTATLGPVYFGDRIASPPPGVHAWTASVDLRPAKNLIVSIDANIDAQTGLATWHLAGLDPDTGLLQTDAQLGFLPPDNPPPSGQGGVSFNVSQKPGLKTGSKIANRATIVFDREAPIDTPTFVNRIDTSTPSSRIRSVKPAKRGSRSCRKLKVAWSGTDTGSGVRYFNVYVARNKGKFVLWRHTSRRSATYSARTRGSYRFRTVATDGVGHVEKPRRSTVRQIRVAC